MDLEEHEGVEPVIERRCAECGTVLTKEEITASLETEGPSSARSTRARKCRWRTSASGA